MDIEARLNELRLKHHVSPDCWYSCPLSRAESEDGGCCDDAQQGCTCGAEAHNAKIDTLISDLRVLRGAWDDETANDE